jgi:hypothetical protein
VTLGGKGLERVNIKGNFPEKEKKETKCNDDDNDNGKMDIISVLSLV